MRFLKTSLASASLAIASYGAFAQGNTATDLAHKTYEWTDAEGNRQSSSLYDIATEPDQIAQLMIKIYTDPEIPGQTYLKSGEGYEEKFDGKIDYDHNKPAWIGWKDKVVEQPTEGMTLIVAKLKDFKPNQITRPSEWDYAGMLKFIATTVESLEVIRDITYVDDDENPGYLAMISGDFNKFYLMSKGKRRETGFALLGCPMFEEISPTSNVPGVNTDSFYEDMQSGFVWTSQHDCHGIITQNMIYPHYFIVNSKDNIKSPLVHLTYFIPDKRMYYWSKANDPELFWENASQRDDNGIFSWYHPRHAPLTFIYRASLEANIVDDPDDSRKCIVTVDWRTNLSNENINIKASQSYDLYVREKGTSEWILLQEDTRALTHTYNVDRKEIVYDLEYQVRAHVDGYDDNEFAFTNIDFVTVPPINVPLIMESVHPYYRSRFDPIKELNLYKNTFNLRRTSDIKPGVYSLRRAGLSVARLSVNANGDCTVEYLNQNLDYTFDEEVPATSGNVKDGILVIDRFHVSTASNDHPDHYDYTLDGMKGSLTVPVYKSDMTSVPHGYSADEIDSDTDHSLQMQGTDLTLDTPLGDNIDVYEAYRNGVDRVSQKKPNGDSATDTDLASPAHNWYVAQVTTRRNDMVDTYGTARDRSKLPEVSIQASNCHTVPVPGQLDAALVCDLEISSEIPAVDGYSLIGYRVWRQVDDRSEKLIEIPLQATSVSEAVSPYSLSISHLWPAESRISVTDSTDELTSGIHQQLKYLVRAFMEGPDGKISFAEATTSASSSNITGIDEIGSDADATVIYYSPTGLSSSTPFEGVNIVVKHIDGKQPVITREIH